MINKKYLNISQVSKMLQIEEYKIRYWDSIDPKTNKFRVEVFLRKVRVVQDILTKKILKNYKNLRIFYMMVTLIIIL